MSISHRCRPFLWRKETLPGASSTPFHNSLGSAALQGSSFVTTLICVELKSRVRPMPDVREGLLLPI